MNKAQHVIENAIAAHGKWDVNKCQCDSAKMPCDYCAVYQGLQSAHIMVLTDDKLTIANLTNKVNILEGALQLVAAPKRPDGTYNRCREACEILAREAINEINKAK